MRPYKIDPITAEVVGNALQSIADQMGVTLVRSAFSTNIKERRDCSCAIFMHDGSLAALAEHIPIHLGSMQGLMSEISRNLESWNLKPGDVIISNDPYRGGGSHLPDITLIQPVFVKNRLVAFMANIAHWSDVGGRSPGVGTSAASTDLYQEGLRIPPMRIIIENKIQSDVLNFLLANMRNRQERWGDFHAQIASLRLGERRMQDLFKRYSSRTIAACMSEIQDYSERQLRSALQEIPEGSFSFTDYMDDDGISEEPLAIRVKVNVTHGRKPKIAFDFRGTSHQASGGINMVWAALMATVYYSVKALVGPKIPLNRGFQRPISIKAPKGSVVNAQEPAAVGGRTDTCQRVVDTIFGALAKAIPERAIAASSGATTAVIFGGTKALSGQDFIYVEALGGGMGAHLTRDGMDGIQIHITNTSNLPIESMEMEYPLRVLRYELVRDSGGPGKYRGGLSIRKDIKTLVPLLFSAHSDRHRIPPWGLMGGKPGARGRFLLNPGKARINIVRSKIAELKMNCGDVLSVQTAGGGGFGSPHDRNPQLVSRDFIQGKISRRQAKEPYKVVLTKEGKVNWKETEKLRSRKNDSE